MTCWRLLPGQIAIILPNCGYQIGAETGTISVEYVMALDGWVPAADPVLSKGCRQLHPEYNENVIREMINGYSLWIQDFLEMEGEKDVIDRMNDKILASTFPLQLAVLSKTLEEFLKISDSSHPSFTSPSLKPQDNVAGASNMTMPGMGSGNAPPGSALPRTDQSVSHPFMEVEEDLGAPASPSVVDDDGEDSESYFSEDLDDTQSIVEKRSWIRDHFPYYCFICNLQYGKNTYQTHMSEKHRQEFQGKSLMFCKLCSDIADGWNSRLGKRDRPADLWKHYQSSHLRILQVI